ncbi:MAG: V-type ATPase subunit [Myxococcales bacterium]
MARLAFAYARTRALRGSLLGPEDADRLRSASGAAAQSSALHALGIDAANPAEVHAALVARFAVDADKLVRAWPIGRGLLLAIVGLLEIENLKLVFRALASGAEGWQRHWLALGRVGQLPLEPIREAISLRAAVETMTRTPYGAIAAQVLRAHEKDPAAAEMALDRWASVRLLAEARRADQDGARELAMRVVRERDLDALLREAYAVPPEAAAGTTALLREEMRPEALKALAAWRPGAGPLTPLLPRKLVQGTFNDTAALRTALLRTRREACLRAFAGPPFRLASAVALLLLRIEEVHAASALAESRWEPEVPPPSEALGRAVAASAMGA